MTALATPAPYHTHTPWPLPTVCLSDCVRRVMPTAPSFLVDMCIMRLKGRWAYRAKTLKQEQYPSGPRQGGTYYVKAMPTEEADALMTTWVPWALRQIQGDAQQIADAAAAQLAGLQLDDAAVTAVGDELELLESVAQSPL